MVTDSENRTKNLLADYAKEVAGIGERFAEKEEQDRIDRIAAEIAHRADLVKALDTHIRTCCGSNQER